MLLIARLNASAGEQVIRNADVRCVFRVRGRLLTHESVPLSRTILLPRNSRMKNGRQGETHELMSMKD